MPTNTTTPEAATTTTPATNTNTTPLSAMTGEEVASILVGLIRQNDGVLIQTELENALRSTGYAAIANDMAQGKQALYTLLQSKGVTIQGNESISECCTLLNAACLTIGDSVLASGVDNPKAYLFLNDDNGDMFKKVSDATATSVSMNLVGQNIEEISFPLLTSGTILDTGGKTLYAKCISIPSYNNPLNNLFNTRSYSGTNTLINLRHIIGTTPNYYGENGGHNTAVNLYDYKAVNGITVNSNVSEWIPTNALSSARQSLCDQDEWDDPNEPQGGFANNLQKFLWYFEYHFIPCFGTVTTSPVLSLYTTVYNAINSANSIAQPTKTLKQLLTDKGWEVASVS